MKKLKAEKITCIAVHGIFAENALNKIKKTGVNIITTNTIPSKTSRIDVSKVIADGLRN